MKILRKFMRNSEKYYHRDNLLTGTDAFVAFICVWYFFLPVSKIFIKSMFRGFFCRGI